MIFTYRIHGTFMRKAMEIKKEFSDLEMNADLVLGKIFP